MKKRLVKRLLSFSVIGALALTSLSLPVYAEEAAYGAALFALMLCRGVRAEEIRAFIRYFRTT